MNNKDNKNGFSNFNNLAKEKKLMAGDKNTGKGFAGLSDLVSEISSINVPIKQEVNTDIKPSTTPKESRSVNDNTIELTDTNEVKPSTTPSSENFYTKFFGLGIILIIMIWLLYTICDTNEKKNKSPSYTHFTSSQEYSSTQNTPPLISQAPSLRHDTNIQYEKPSPGENNILSISEIRWCIRERIRLETMRDVVDNNVGINKFNNSVADYNIRCASYRYHQREQAQAERDVEAHRSQIVSDAIYDARQLGHSY